MIVADASVLMEVLLRTAVGTEVEKQLFAVADHKHSLPD
jgi:hypothetical protein